VSARPLDRAALRLMVLAGLDPEAPDDGLDRVRAALRGGATLIQARAKGAPAGELLAWTRRLLPLCDQAGVPLMVNDRPDLARAAGAAGAHVGPDDLPPAAARRVLDDLALGVSARTEARLREAEAAGAAYVGVGAFRATDTKTEAAVIGLEGIRRLIGATSLPVVAVGGIRPEDLPALRAAGAAGVAVVSGILAAGDPETAARAYSEAWERTSG
jgi:thiamine-phosphate pyrophosphorylase